MLYKVTHCTERILANTRPHQTSSARWGDRKMGTALSCTECSPMASLIYASVVSVWQCVRTCFSYVYTGAQLYMYLTLSLVPRLLVSGEKKSLVSTVCSCA